VGHHPRHRRVLEQIAVVFERVGQPAVSFDHDELQVEFGGFLSRPVAFDRHSSEIDAQPRRANDDRDELLERGAERRLQDELYLEDRRSRRVPRSRELLNQERERIILVFEGA
jgi:hypothetical protein